jgi:hypothetical protein
MSAMPPDAASLDQIIRYLQRLTPSWQRPEVFHQFKSELIDKLRTMLRHPLVTRHVVRLVQTPPRDRHSRHSRQHWRRDRADP